MVFRYIPALLAMGSLLPAHHQIDPEYDRSQRVEYKATVTKLEFKNPHVLLSATVAGKTGEWVFEMGAPNLLIRYNLAKDFVDEGDQITIHALPARDGSNWGRVVRITWPDGKKYEDEGILYGKQPVDLTTKAPANPHKSAK